MNKLLKKSFFVSILFFYGILVSFKAFSMDDQEDNLQKLNVQKWDVNELIQYNVEDLNKLRLLIKEEEKIKKNALAQEHTQIKKEKAQIEHEKAQLQKSKDVSEQKFKKKKNELNKNITKAKEKRESENAKSQKQIEIIQNKLEALNALDNLQLNSINETVTIHNPGKVEQDLKTILRSTEKNRQKERDKVLDYFEDLEEANGLSLNSFDKITEPLYCGLSMDGGGTRGLIVSLYLKKIEELSGKRISQLFDYIGGTSVGGIISLGLVAGEKNIPYYNADKFVELFSKKSHIIFPKSSNKIQNIGYDIMGVLWSSRYSEAPLMNILNEYFKNLTLSQAIKPVLVTAVNINSFENNKSYTFESIKSVSNKNDDFFMRDVARATSAAPTYFPAAQIKNVSQNIYLSLVDGGLWFNNPSQLIYNRMVKLYDCKNDKLMILSLGTGRTIQQGMNILPERTGKIRAIPAVIDTLMTSSSDGVDSEMLNLLGSHYYRIQSTLEQSVDLDGSSSDIMQFLEYSAETQYRKLKPITRFLVKNYDKKKDPY